MTRPTPATEFFAAMTDLLTAGDPQPAPVAAPMVRCTFCGGSGESHSAQSDNTCPACDGVGKRRADWREHI
jgi:hypothetical protein